VTAIARREIDAFVFVNVKKKRLLWNLQVLDDYVNMKIFPHSLVL